MWYGFLGRPAKYLVTRGVHWTLSIMDWAMTFSAWVVINSGSYLLSLLSSLLPVAASVYTFNDPIHRHVNTHNIASDQGTQFIRKLGGGAVYLLTRKQLLS